MVVRSIPGVGQTEMAPLSASQETIAELLDETELAKQFTWQELLQLCGYMQLLAAPPEVVVVAEHSTDAYLCVLARGVAEVYKEDSGGGRRRLATMRKGRVFGEVAILDNWPRSASVVAATDCRIAVLSRPELDRLNSDLPELGLKLIWWVARTLAVRLRETSGALVDYLDPVR